MFMRWDCRPVRPESCVWLAWRSHNHTIRRRVVQRAATRMEGTLPESCRHILDAAEETCGLSPSTPHLLAKLLRCDFLSAKTLILTGNFKACANRKLRAVKYDGGMWGVCGGKWAQESRMMWGKKKVGRESICRTVFCDSLWDPRPASLDTYRSKPTCGLKTSAGEARFC
jgi:hypothetical protein